MKRNIITVALFAVLATMAVSCQKENFMEPQSSVMEVDSVRSVLYSVNGVEHSVTLYNDEEWDAFVDTMMSLARQGYDVRFVDQNAAAHSIATKDTQTYTTSNQADAKAWAKEKAGQGYSVSTSYTNGQFVVHAVK